MRKFLLHSRVVVLPQHFTVGALDEYKYRNVHTNTKKISYSTVVLYIRDDGDLGFPSQKIYPKTSFTTPSWHLGSIG